MRRALDQALERASRHPAGPLPRRRRPEHRFPCPRHLPGSECHSGSVAPYLPVTSYADTAYLEAVQQHIWQVIKLDGRFGGADLANSVLESRDRLSPRVKMLFLVRKARALAQGGDEQALTLFDQARSHYQDGTRDSDPKWAWWVDERELAWHEGMALADLGKIREAVGRFEQSVAATAPYYARGRYLHLGYLLGAQVQVGAWSDAETTMRQIGVMVGGVASTRGVVLLARILPELQREHVAGSTRETAEQ